MTTKTCRICKEEKSLRDFPKRIDSKDGVRTECKECLKYLKSNVWDSHDKEGCEKRKKNNRNKYTHEWYAKHPTITKICSSCNKEKSLIEFGKGLLGLYGKRSDCKECVNSKSSEYKKNHRELTNSQHYEYYNRVLRFDKKFRITTNISSSISKSLKGKKEGKHWEDLVGYTRRDLMQHLKSQFDDKMNFDNYGEYWHLDHIIPVCSYDFKSYEDDDFKRCWSLENLRPLYKIENLKKNNIIFTNDDIMHLLPQRMV